MDRRLPFVFIVALWLMVPTAALAIAEFESEDGDYSLEIVGSERFTLAFLHYPDLPDPFPSGSDWLGASVTRLMLDGSLGEVVTFEANFFIDFTRTPPLMLDGSFATAGSHASPYRYYYLTGEFMSNGAVTGHGGIDRLAFIFDFDAAKLSIGRLPVNYSVTRIFTPNDFFAPFSATAVNTMYKPGVDAIRATFSPGMVSSIEIVGVMGADHGGDSSLSDVGILESDSDHVPSLSHSAMLIHARTVYREAEWALMGGKLAERWIVGGSIQAPAGRANIRAEGHVGFPHQEDSPRLNDLNRTGEGWDDLHVRLAVGFDVLFDWQNASIGCEYLYMSDGADDTDQYLPRALRFFPDDLFYLGKHYVGLSAGSEIIPILQVMAMGLLNAKDLSGMGVLSFILNLADEADMVGGLMAPWGKKPDKEGIHSEYGLSPLYLFFETRVYF